MHHNMEIILNYIKYYISSFEYTLDGSNLAVIEKEVMPYIL